MKKRKSKNNKSVQNLKTELEGVLAHSQGNLELNSEAIEVSKKFSDKKRPDFKTFKQKLLQDAEFKKEYDALKPEFDLIRESIKARLKKGT